MEDPLADRDPEPPIPQPSRTGIPLLLGAIGGLLFLFVFPKGSITTVMHDVLHLPGPGAGIALILGPVALLFILLSSHSVRLAPGGALPASLAFAMSYAIPAKIFALPTSTKGMFGSARFIIALAVCGVAAEILLSLTRRLRPPWGYVLTACGANTALLVFYWLAIFPRTKGWIAWEDVPLLLLLNLVGAAVAGAAGWAVGRRILDLTDSAARRQTDVRTG